MIGDDNEVDSVVEISRLEPFQKAADHRGGKDMVITEGGSDVEDGCLHVFAPFQFASSRIQAAKLVAG